MLELENDIIYYNLQRCNFYYLIGSKCAVSRENYSQWTLETSTYFHF